MAQGNHRPKKRKQSNKQEINAGGVVRNGPCLNGFRCITCQWSMMILNRSEVEILDINQVECLAIIALSPKKISKKVFKTDELWRI